MEYKYKILSQSQNVVYQHFIYMYNTAAGSHKELLKKNLPVHHSLFAKLLGSVLQVSSSLSATVGLFYSEM